MPTVEKQTVVVLTLTPAEYKALSEHTTQGYTEDEEAYNRVDLFFHSPAGKVK